MTDWRANLESRLEKERREEEQRKQRAKERKLAKEATQHARQVAAHQARFSCHVCGLSSTGPKTEVSDNYPEMTHYSTWTNWREPDNLQRCNRCGHYTCSNDMHKGICRKCAARL